MVGRLAATECKLRYPTFFNKIIVIKVVKVILELFELDKHSGNIEEHFIPYIYLCL